MKVCLVTTGQPSTNPRLVKEADALVGAGCDVNVVGAFWANWASETDAALLREKPWRLHAIDWRRNVDPWLFWKTRVRHRLARAVTRWPALDRMAAPAALSRLTPELIRLAVQHPADLYIAHNLGALPAAAAAARVHRARLGFDAEDFHSGQISPGEQPGLLRVTESAERQFLPRCSSVTAASPGIADQYAALCKIPRPVVVLNVFPLKDRPEQPMPPHNHAVRLYWFSQTIGPDRGLECVVDAMGLIRDVPLELHLRGRVQDGFDERLRVRAAHAGVPPERINVHEPADPRDMVRLAARYDIGLAVEPGHSTNNQLALSNKIFAYVLAGVPVALSRTTAQAAIAPELRSAAVTFDADDAPGLARALRPWLASPAALATARAEAWRLGEQRFNWDREAAAFLGAVGLPSAA